MSTVLMSPPRSIAKTASAVIRLEAERYQCAAAPRLPAAAKWSASSAAEPQSLIDATGFQVAAWRPRLSIHEVSRSSGAKIATGLAPAGPATGAMALRARGRPSAQREADQTGDRPNQ